MLEYIAPLVMVVAFSSAAPLWKILRQEGMSPQAILAITGLLWPLWFVMLTYFFFSGILVTWQYLGLVISWAVLAYGRHSISLYLMKYKALSELGAYSIAFSLLISLVIDTVYFGESFSLKTLAAFGVFIVASIMLSKSRSHLKKRDLAKTMGLLLFSSILMTGFLSLYKVGLSMQPIWVHVAISQFVISSLFLAWGHKPLFKALHKRTVKKRYVAYGLVLMCTGIVAEAFALQVVPVSVVIISMLLPLITFATFDVYRKDLEVERRTIGAAILILLGFGLLFI